MSFRLKIGKGRGGRRFRAAARGKDFGMELSTYVDVSLKVLRDWRVLACALGIFAAWGLFRYVGVISRRGPRRYSPPAKPASPKSQPQSESPES